MSEVRKLNPYEAHSNAVMDIPEKLPTFKGGNYLLVYPIEFDQKTSGGIFMADSALDTFNSLQTVGKVVKMAPQAYKRDIFWSEEDQKHLSLCEVGDFIVFSRLVASTKVIFMGQAFYVLPDSAVLYTVDNPEDIYNGKYKINYGEKV